jgi:hypothetical protein
MERCECGTRMICLKSSSYCDIQVNVSATRLFACESIEYTTLHVFDVHTGSEIYSKSLSSFVCESLDGTCIIGSSYKSYEGSFECWDAETGSAVTCPITFLIASLTGGVRETCCFFSVARNVNVILTILYLARLSFGLLSLHNCA